MPRNPRAVSSRIVAGGIVRKGVALTPPFAKILTCPVSCSTTKSRVSPGGDTSVVGRAENRRVEFHALYETVPFGFEAPSKPQPDANE